MATARAGVAVIVGANRGIGLSLALEFVKSGYHVVGTARKTGDADDGVKDLRGAGVHLLPLDVSDAKMVGSFCARVGELLAQQCMPPAVDVLICNAAVYERDEETSAGDVKVSAESMRRSFDINTIAPLMLAQEMKPLLVASGPARPKLIFISSQMGSIADNTSGGSYAYRASKVALNMIAKSLSVDMPQVTTVAMHPGYVTTRMTGGRGNIDPATCATIMCQTILKLDAKASGSFVRRDGEPLPW